MRDYNHREGTEGPRITRMRKVDSGKGAKSAKGLDSGFRMLVGHGER